MAVAEEPCVRTIQPTRLPCSHPLHLHFDHHDNNIIHHRRTLRQSSSSSRPNPRRFDVHDHRAIHLEHEYLRALISGDRTLAGGFRRPFSQGQGFEGVSMPASVVMPGGGGSGHAFMRSFSLPHDKTMDKNASVESVSEASIPSSPPELSYSKSSKSSSSINSDDDLSDSALTEKSTHFEEVALEDIGRDSGEDCNQPPDSRPTLRRPTPRSLTIGDVSMRRKSGTSPQLRPLPNGMRQKFPSLQGAVSGVLKDQSLNLPNGRRSMQRAASSPTSPFVRHNSQRIPSRSPSPNKPLPQNGYCVSPQTLSSATSRDSYEEPKENSGVQPRVSWQPGRKTVQELEAEYNDEDEEVPDEAILENVPISPLPGQYSVFKSPSSTTVRSLTPSPNRRPSYANLHSANLPKQAKRPSNGLPRSPKRSRPHMMPHSATASAFPPDVLSRKHRSKSWTEDLNNEARQLSQALEEYSERLSMEKRASTTANTPSSSPPRPTIPKTRAQTCTAEIPITLPIPTVPPLQKGNIMIDPLPISKEKEAVLTRTRPSWLPPKSQKEEKKHLKEFQQMMARAAEAEKKRALKEQEDKDSKQEMQGSIARIWEQHVIPNWDAVIREPRTRELWWRGVTPKSRGEVWQRAIGNELELSTTSFEAALARAHTLEEKFVDMPDMERANSKEAAWMDAIARDVPNTFPELNMYQRGATLHDSLSHVLKAYAMYRSDVGYVYGTHLVAGIICAMLPAPQAFVLLANLLNRPLPLAFLVHDQTAMARAYALTLQTLKYKNAKLHDHLTSPALDLHPHEFLDPMFRCLFAYHLPLEHACRLWDVFVFEGDRTLIRGAVAVLSLLEGRLYAGREAVLDVLGWRNERGVWGKVGGEEEFVIALREAGKVDGEKKRVSSV